MEYADGVYRRTGGNDGWINFNDNNQVYRRNDSNSGWIAGDANSGYATIYRRNGSNNGWIQLYPAGVIKEDSPIVSVEGTAKMATKQKAFSRWKTGDARQGWCKRDGAGGEQFGIITCNYSNIPGGGKVVEPGSPKFSGKTGASGNYNNTQTIQFRGCSHGSFSGDPFGKHDSSGYFGFTWRSKGANTAIPEGDLNLSGNNGRNAFLRWVNNTSSFGTNLCIYNGETSNDVGWSFDPSPSNGFSNNYLTIAVFKMRVLGYTYSAKRMIISEYDSGKSIFAMGVPKEQMKCENYLSIALAEDVDDSNVEDIIHGIENGKLHYRDSADMMSYSDFDYKPIIFDQVDNILTTSPIFDEDTVVEYKYNEKWNSAICISPRNYSFLKGATDARIMNKTTGEVYFEMPVQ